MTRLDHPEVRRAQRRELWAELVAAGIVFAAMLVMASAMQSCAGHASAQLDEDDALILARLTVHEAGWDSPADAVLIHQVLLGIVERDGVSYARAAELAAPRLARCAVCRIGWRSTSSSKRSQSRCKPSSTSQCSRRSTR